MKEKKDGDETQRAAKASRVVVLLGGSESRQERIVVAGKMMFRNLSSSKLSFLPVTHLRSNVGACDQDTQLSKKRPAAKFAAQATVRKYDKGGFDNGEYRTMYFPENPRPDQKQTEAMMKLTFERCKPTLVGPSLSSIICTCS